VFTDPTGLQTVVLPYVLPWSLPVPMPGPGIVLPPVLINPSESVENPLDNPDIDMGDTGTWPTPPVEGPVIEGDPSRKKPKERGEKSYYDENGGEWRPHLRDPFHEPHWDHKPPSTPEDKYPRWWNVAPSTVPTLDFDVPMT